MLTLQLHKKLGARGRRFSVLHRLILNSRPRCQLRYKFPGKTIGVPPQGIFKKHTLFPDYFLLTDGLC
uniref:Uncharacterized protein n=1 Tax=Arundo donax TaxID=35708 RepID=A0A0A9CNV8_ARUDO